MSRQPTRKTDTLVGVGDGEWAGAMLYVGSDRNRPFGGAWMERSAIKGAKRLPSRRRAVNCLDEERCKGCGSTDGIDTRNPFMPCVYCGWRMLRAEQRIPEESYER